MNDEPHTQIREMQAQFRERPAPATREAPKAENIWAQVWEQPWLAFAVIAILPGFVLSLLGPFGSFAAPVWMRFAYWMPTMALAACIGAGISIWSERAPVFTARPLARYLFVTTGMTAAMTGVAWGMGTLVFGPGAIRFSPQFIFYVWLITMVVSMISAILRARRDTRIEVAAAPVLAASPALPPSLTARLPAKLKGGTILALQAEDHYVRIHTDKGSDLVLMRLADATEQMGATPGARTHRSWWVSKSAVKSIRRDNGRVALVLTNDTEAPVSRGYASELREAGWLDAREAT
ncbi:MAG: LytTR family transcriptional regulator DNA-binding domain-containing protein [Alphaproteobacteria bacterium]|nr:LytTR family transcriptional regulator DNA-binding domain-containing protein [Alphaproteobacteria bacterium]